MSPAEDLVGMRDQHCDGLIRSELGQQCHDPSQGNGGEVVVVAWAQGDPSKTIPVGALVEGTVFMVG